MQRIIPSTFQPAWWIKSPHLQTLWPVFLRKRPRLTLTAERVELSDGDFIDLAWHSQDRESAPIVMVIHGLEGSLKSHYAPTLLKALYQAGFNSVFMHLRGRSGTPNRLARSYHSGLTADVIEVVDYLAKTRRPVFALIGFSLGGNLTLKYLGQSGHNTPIKTAVAISVPFQLNECAIKLEHGFARLYGWHLLHNLKTSYQRKFKQRSSPIKPDFKQIQTLYQFDDAITAPLNGFQNAADYYAKSSSSQYLKYIRVPTLIIHSTDDPFMYPSTVPAETNLSENIILELTQYGGHVGFVSGNIPGKAHYWLEQRIIDWLKQHLEPL